MPRFPRYHHPRVSLGKRSNQLKDFEHLRAFAQYIFKIVLLVNSLPQFSNFFQKPSSFDEFLTYKPNGLWLKRFSDIIACPQFHRFDCLFYVAKRGGEDYVGFW